MTFPIDLGNVYTTPNTTDKLNNPSHTARHQSESEEIQALKVKVGIDSSAVATSHDYKISTNKSSMDTHIARIDNPHSVTKTQVGLGNLDNTSDANKPVSTSVQTALDLKANDADFGKCINRQDNTTNNVVTDQSIQSGWGFITGDGVNIQLTETVTFPVAFDSAPIVIIVYCGALTVSDPTLISDLVVASNVTRYYCESITDTNFLAIVTRAPTDGNPAVALSATSRYGYSWIAIGTKARWNWQLVIKEV
jgi:hypothetical protein